MLSTEINGAKLNKSTEAKVSVIIVTYNAAETLQNCLDSIYSQRYPAIEIIVIDGKSTDGTVKILEENTDRIHYWKSEEDEGIYDAMNKALKHVTGDWVYFLGADDVLFDAFTDFVYELKQDNTIYYSRVMCLRGPSISVNAYTFLKYGICHQAIIYPKAVFEQNTFDTKYKIAADYALNMKLFQSGTFHFAFKEYLIANFNHTGISSISLDKIFENDKASLVFRYFGFKIWAKFIFWRFKKTYIRKPDKNQNTDHTLAL